MPTKEWKLVGEVKGVGRNETTKLTKGEDGKEHPVDAEVFSVTVKNKNGDTVTFRTAHKLPLEAGEDVSVLVRYGSQSKLG